MIMYIYICMYVCTIDILVNWPWVEVSLDLREDGFVATARGMAVGRRMADAKWRETEDRGWSIGLPMMVYDNPQSTRI